MNTKYKTLLSIIKDATTPLTTAEIYETLEPADQGMFKGVFGLSKVLSDIKRKNRYLDNAETEYENGKAKLRWFINKKGIEALIADNDTRFAIKEANPKLKEKKVMNDEISNNNENIGIIEIEQNPLDYFDTATSSIRDMLEIALKNEQASIKIADKEEKLKTLKELYDFIAPMNKEKAMILSDIMDDIEHLDSDSKTPTLSLN